MNLPFGISDDLPRFLSDFTREQPLWLQMPLYFLVGAVIGRWLAYWIAAFAMDATPGQGGKCPHCGCRRPWRERIPLFGSLVLRHRCGQCGQPIRNWTWLVEVGTGVLFMGLIVAMTRFACQDIHEVRPTGLWFYGRVAYQLVLVSLLVIATGTDFREYIIPDEVIYFGVAVGVAGAALSGDLQMVHLWVDWSQAFPGLRGPYIPGWMASHQHLHGLAWSLAGMVAGGGITWIVRWISSTILGHEAMGFGDVTLMAMIGSFMGWQPILFVLALAPVCGLVVGISVRMLTGKTYVPFGPYLSAAAVLVLFTWKWLWIPTRSIFGHWPTLLMLAGICCAAFIGLLLLVRIYRLIPGR